jgi:ABC-2 type transport system ATP-binding protein
MDIAIEASELTKRYAGVPALKNVSLEVKRGEIFGFLGQNGAGKTTFMKILLDLCKPSSGDVKLFGQKIDTKAKLQIGYLPEKVSIPGFLSAEEFLRYCAKLSGLKGNDLIERPLKALKTVGLEDHRDDKVGGFSKGMVQRLGLAQAIQHEPDLLLLDEPQSGLDPKGAIDLRNIILQSNEKLGTTIFLNSHRLMEAEMICSRVGILQKGTMVAIGKMDDLTRSKNQIKLELSSINEEIQTLLVSISSQLQSTGENSVLFQPKENVETRKIPALLVEKGAEIIRYEKASENLEEVFLRLIGDNK